MRCHACDVAVDEGQRFCHECGAVLDGVTNPTEAVDVIEDGTPSEAITAERAGPDGSLSSESVDAPTHAEPPRPHRGALPDLKGAAATPAPPPQSDQVAAPTHDEVVAAAAPLDAVFRPTEAVDEVPSAPSNPLDNVPWRTDESPVVTHEPTATMPATAIAQAESYDATIAYPPAGLATTGELDAHSGGLFDGADEIEVPYEPEGFKLRASFVFAFLAMVATLMASIADVIDLRTSVPIDGIAPGIRILDDIGTNLAIGGYIGAAVMVVGGLLACFGLRWGAGLAGGAGLAVAGWAALTIGLAEQPLFAAETTFRESEASGLITPGAVLTTTRDLGWFLLLAVGLLGGIVFLVSLRQAGTGPRRGLNPWVAALGALGSVVLAAGPLIPLGNATLNSNLGFDTEPRAFFAGRLVQLGLLVLTGVLGFLSVRTYGLGLAAGGMSIVIWMWATTLADLGSAPVGPALGNLGDTDTTPHAVTGVGVAVSILMLAIAVTIAAVQRPRHA